MLRKRVGRGGGGVEKGENGVKVSKPLRFTSYVIWWELVPVVDQLFCVYLVFKWLLVANSNVAQQVVSWQLRRQSCLFVHHNGSTFCGMNL